jgi:Uma2 family endonuclease
MPSTETEYTLDKIIWIASERENDPESLQAITEEEVINNSEETLQLKEGCSYEYEILDQSFSLNPIPGIIHQSRKYPFRGRITPGNYVGRLPLRILTSSEPIDIAVEVRSSKSNYRDEYRKMLQEITVECTDLLMIHSSPVTPNPYINVSHLYSQW